MGDGRILPPFSTGQPMGARRIFDVSVTNLAALRAPLACILIGLCFLLVADACAVWGPAAVRQKDVTAKVLFFIATAAVLPFAWQAWRRYVDFKANPLVMAVYDTGVWLRQQDMFLPFERVTDIEVNSNDGLRKIYFRFTLDGAGEPSLEDNSYVRRLRRARGSGCIALPGQDGVFNLPHAEVARQTHEIAARRAASAPPRLAIADPPLPGKGR